MSRRSSSARGRGRSDLHPAIGASTARRHDRVRQQRRPGHLSPTGRHPAGRAAVTTPEHDERTRYSSHRTDAIRCPGVARVRPGMPTAVGVGRSRGLPPSPARCCGLRATRMTCTSCSLVESAWWINGTPVSCSRAGCAVSGSAAQLPRPPRLPSSLSHIAISLAAQPVFSTHVRALRGRRHRSEGRCGPAKRSSLPPIPAGKNARHEFGVLGLRSSASGRRSCRAHTPQEETT